MNTANLTAVPDGTYQVCNREIVEIKQGEIIDRHCLSHWDLSRFDEFPYFDNEQAWNALAAATCADVPPELVSDNVSFGVLVR